MANWSRRRISAWAGTFVLAVFIPVALAQNYFRYNAYILPVTGLLALLFYVLLLVTHPTVSANISNFHQRFGTAHPLMHVAVVAIVVGAMSLVVCLGEWYAIRKSQEHVAELKKADAPKPAIVPMAQSSPPAQFEGKKELAAAQPYHKQRAEKNSETPDGTPHRSEYKTEPPQVRPSPPGSVNNCPNGICISGGTVTNPVVVNNGPPPAKLTVALGPQNKQNLSMVAVNGRPNPETLYRSIFLIDVTGSAIPRLLVSAKGHTLRQVECGQVRGLYPTITAVNDEASCTMNGVFGNDWFVGIQTLSPVSPGDIHIDLVCYGIKCEQ